MLLKKAVLLVALSLVIQPPGFQFIRSRLKFLLRLSGLVAMTVGGFL